MRPMKSQRRTHDVKTCGRVYGVLAMAEIMDAVELEGNSLLHLEVFDRADWIEDLIHQVEGYPVVYDTKSKDFWNKSKRDACWKAVAITLNKPSDECESTWCKLRDRYTRELRRSRSKGPSGTNGKGRKQTWVYFHAMNFIKQFIQHRSTSASVPINRDENIVSPSANVSLPQASSVQSPRPSASSEYSRPSTTREDYIGMDNFHMAHQNTKPDPVKKSSAQEEIAKAVKETNSSIQCMLEYIQRQSTRVATVSSEVSHEEHFLLSILPRFQALPDNAKLQFQLDVLNLLLQAQNNI